MTEFTPPLALEERGHSGERLSSPSVARNREPITQALSERLVPGARVLEIASGTGEHALAIVKARPDLVWTPSDPDPASRGSQNAWAKDADGQIQPALDLDVTRPGWSHKLETFEAIYCSNMIHIAPWSAAEGLFQQAGGLLSPEGAIYLYGPFRLGAETVASNLDFDASLKLRDPRWGVRELADVDALAHSTGFVRHDRLDMPSNNLLLTYQRSVR